MFTRCVSCLDDALCGPDATGDRFPLDVLEEGIDVLGRCGVVVHLVAYISITRIGSVAAGPCA